MYRIPAFLLLMAVLAGGLSAVTIETAHTRFYAEDEIRPLSRYFGGDIAGQRFRAVVPSQPDNPGGQYFIARLKDFRPASPASVRMVLYTSASKEPATHEWKLAGVDLKGWLYLGLTGSDWPDEKTRPLAWRIEVLDAAGEIIAHWNSFLWELE